MLGLPYARLAIACAAAVAVYLAGYSTHKVIADRKIAALRAEMAEMKERAATAAKDAANDYRNKEHAWRATADAAIAKAAAADSRRRSDASAAATTAVGLRDDAAILARGRDAAVDSVAAARADAAKLAELLGVVEAEGRAMAEAADRHRNEVVLLLEAWPK